MFIIEYSKDILFIVMAFAILWLTAFLTWFLYYLIAAAKEIRLATRSVKQQIDEVESMISAFKERFLKFSTYGLALTQILKKVADYVKNEPAFKTARQAKAKRQTAKKGPRHDPEASNFMQEEL